MEYKEQLSTAKEAKEEPVFVINDLVESNISQAHLGLGKLYEAESRPNKIIRVENVDDLLARYNNKIDTVELVRIADKLFKELESEYGILVPAEFFIGKDGHGNEVVYSIVDKIKGEHLKKSEYSSELVSKSEKLYASIAKYFLDKFKKKEIYLCDINSQDQYIFGRKSGEQAQEIYLIDTDICMNNSLVGMYLVVEWLTRHMIGIEKKFEVKFKEAREYIAQFLLQPLPGEMDDSEKIAVNKNIVGIKKFLNNEKLGDGPEPALPTFK